MKAYLALALAGLTFVGCQQDQQAMVDTSAPIEITASNVQTVVNSKQASNLLVNSISQRSSQLATDSRVYNRALNRTTDCFGGGEMIEEQDVIDGKNVQTIEFVNCHENGGIINGKFTSIFELSQDFNEFTTDISGNLRLQLGDEFIEINPLAMQISQVGYISTIAYQMHYEIHFNGVAGQFDAYTQPSLTLDYANGLTGTEVFSGADGSELTIVYEAGKETVYLNGEEVSVN